MTTVIYPAGLRADGLPAALSDPVRLTHLRATGLLGTGPEAAFDDLVGLAAGLTGCARAFVTLVDDTTSFWKSCLGVDATAPEDRQKPVGESFCTYVIGLADRFAVVDAARDPRTRDHPSVGPMRIGAWAGHPILSTGGEVLGSLCVIDEDPHDWTPSELATLETLARSVSNEINLRRSLVVAQASQRASTELARSLQESLLPPVLATVPGIQAAASYLPAGGNSVLGDFYDLFHAKGAWWSAVLGDVCGKGVEAAKVTALARYTVRADTGHHLSPAAVLRRLNTAMLDQPGPRRFLTAVQATFRVTDTGVAGRLCLGGHLPGLIRRANGRVQQIGVAGSLLGILDGVDLTDVRFRLGPGDAMLLYTDGATECRAPATATSPAGPFFEEEGLAAALAECATLSAQQIVDHLGQVLSAHSRGSASDDTALLALKVPARPPADRSGSPSGKG
ncbi:PP2C family protein-serine/threonine phosphatase [Umezawaea sp. NPDC059074]|uniref:PP2C family protein-serine/threonine phosphatase n=1 Tax=Umezawaea sp. NPDC059074 TaxID=3346716 RepID=UPI003688F794